MSKIAFQMRNVGIYPTGSADAHLVVLSTSGYLDLLPESEACKPVVGAACCVKALVPALAWLTVEMITGVLPPNDTASHVIAVNASALYGYPAAELEAIFWHEYGHFVCGHTEGSFLSDDPVVAELEADAYSVSKVGRRVMLRALCRTKVRIVQYLLRLHPNRALPDFSMYKRRAAVLMAGGVV